MSGHEELAGIGKATACQLAKSHRPMPLRYVWHHVLPEACGGTTTPANLVSLCDSEHYSVHILMWWLANGGIPVGVKGTRAELALATTGYQQAVALGVTGKIPKEA